MLKTLVEIIKKIITTFNARPTTCISSINKRKTSIRWAVVIR
jgi:hypothetical protein